MWVNEDWEKQSWSLEKPVIWIVEMSWIKDSVENLLISKIEKIIQELFEKLWYTESDEMRRIKEQILWSGEKIDELFEKYKLAENEYMKWKDSVLWMKSQIWIILVKILYLCKNWKYNLALNEFDDLWNYLDNMPDLDKEIDDLFYELYYEIKKSNP
jgi:hypothetical protein